MYKTSCVAIAMTKSCFYKTNHVIPGKSVASFGDGPGRYKQMMTNTGLLKNYDAYDGAPFS